MRLAVRIWLHGVLLFAGVAVTVLVARFVMPRQDAVVALDAHPELVAGLAERALARRDDPAALARVLAAQHDGAMLHTTIYRADDTVIASSIDPPLPPATAAERAGLAAGELRAGRRFVVPAWRAGALDAYAVARLPSHLVTVHALLLVAAAILLALVFVAIPLARSIARPIARLGALTRRLGAGDLRVRARAEPSLARADELGQLAAAFDDMAAQIQRLRAAERQLLGDVSHELRTPLARVRVLLELAADTDADNRRRYHAELEADLGELERLLDDIITSARLDPDAPHWPEATPPLRRTALDADALAALIDASCARFRARAPTRALVCAPLPAEVPATVTADATLVRRALDNLLDNARAYSADDAPVALAMTATADGVRFAVTDRGVGIAGADRARVFTPFFRADPSRDRATGGIGLSLVLARRIVLAHGGAIDFDSAPGRGSTFWFTLPA